MEELNESLYSQVLKFDETTRTRWMNERKAYAVLFELTSKCNFNCVHCYLQNFHVPDELTTEQVKNILDILCEKGILFLTLTGGEILARRDFLEIYLYAKKKGFLVELFTNGYLFSDEIILALQEYPPLLVSISLYGANDNTYEKITGIKGAFSVVKENCYKLKNAGVRVALKSPILTYTLFEMQDMKQVADEMGLQIVFSFDIHDTIDGSEKPREYQTKLSDALRYEFDERIQKLQIIRR
ncbi:MAG: radical SAM protein [Lachnospiraceae bacterium]|nr:radical SAM protein [Lachnospiraceae bacterium]